MKIEAANKKDNGKQCNHCILKGWKGAGYTKEECWTKKREEAKRAKRTQAESIIEDNKEEFIISIIKTQADIQDHTSSQWFQWDTSTDIHTTNNLSIMSEVNIMVCSHDGSPTKCSKQGTVKCQH